MTLMIALVGGQLLPNFLPVRYYHPEDLLLVYTDGTRKQFNQLKAMLKQETNVMELETDPYDIAKIIHDLEEKLHSPGLADKPLLFNLTGGTKTMSLASYQIAQLQTAPMFYLQSEGKQNRIYYYTWQQKQLASSNNEIIPECIQLREFFDLHFGPGQWKETVPAINTGGYFESAIAETLRTHGFEVLTGVKAMGEQIEIDVAARFENRFAIIEAKTGKEGKALKGIQQLSNAVRHLGTYTQSLYVITVSPSESHKTITEASRIKVVSLTNYVSGSTTLETDDIATLLTTVNSALK